MDTIQQFNSYVMQTYGRLPLVVDNGNGRTCFGEDGKQYIDFGSGIGTNSLGYCDHDWAEAVSEQAHKMQHTSNYYYTKVQADFAKALCDATGYQKIFFGNSGAEANECAIKLARKYSFDKYGLGRHNIITLVNSFHGRTLCTLSATGQDVFHQYFFPFVEGFINSKANDIEDLKSKLDGTICAIMIEFIQGEGGVIPLDSQYVSQVAKICKDNDILLIADEVQTGAGRTGKFLTSQIFGVHPDVTTMAKGLAGGVPVGACLRDFVHDIHAAYHLTESGILTVQMRGIFVHDKKLASGRVGNHRSCHGKNAFRVLEVIFHAVLGKFALDAVARTAHAGAVGAAALNHKALDNAVKGQSVIKFLIDKADKIVYGDRGDFRIQLCLDYVAALHGNGNNRIFCHGLLSFLYKNGL